MTEPTTAAGRLEPGVYPREDGTGFDVIVDLAESTSWVRDAFPDEVEAIEAEARAAALNDVTQALNALGGKVGHATCFDVVAVMVAIDALRESGNPAEG